jgi:glycosyltransferase involved in cell wall biosynthesis
MQTGSDRGVPHIWLLSAYRSDSHAAWADWLTGNLAGIDWYVRELPGRHFAWRIRGNPLSWLDGLPGETPDRILATSMVDLATLKGLHPRLAGVPADYYFHENQFAYPRSDQQVTSIEARMVQLYGALAADRLFFNSGYNRRTFLEGVHELLERMPDHVPNGIGERLAAKCRILPVPVEFVPPSDDRDEGLVVWNHRWEYDKHPDLFADAMLALADQGVNFRLALLGPRPVEPPGALVRLRERLGERIVADGKLARQEYEQVLGRAAIAVSTARHEFQGLGMLEAAGAGARPLVPDALCYPEQYPEPYRYPPGDLAMLVDRLAEWLTGGLPSPVDVSNWTSPVLATAWRDVVRG